MTHQETFKMVKRAGSQMYRLSEEKINRVLFELADRTIACSEYLLNENKKDLARMDSQDPKFDRLKLSKKRLQAIAADIQEVARKPGPLGKVLGEKQLESGLSLKKLSVPLGVIGIIYEARPNVTFDVFSLCLKSGNALVLKGGSDAQASNAAIVHIIHEVLEQNGLDRHIVQLLPSGREATSAMLEAIGYIDILIPRGSKGLIHFVRENARVPVIETGAGIVHTYFDEFADLDKGKQIIVNAKTRRVSVCNALDCLLMHQSRLADLPEIAKGLAAKEVELFADPPALPALEGKYPADKLHPAREEHFGTEFLAMRMSVKTVENLEEALDHIARYSSRHSEAIISENEERVEYFLKAVDAAAVYANTSTAFTDGAQFGMGAEIGISTQKLHARGPMALEELTSYKWVVQSNGKRRD